MKRWQKFLSALALGTAFTASFAAEAAIDTGKLPLKTYVAKRVYCSNNVGTTSNSYWIDAENDLVVIKQYQGDWAYGTYPTKKGHVSRWFKMSDVLPDIGFANYETTPKHNQIVYRTPTSSSTIGTVYGTDKIVIVGESNGRTQIIYGLSNGGGYKMGWVPDNSINKRSNTSYNSSSARTSQPQVIMGNTNKVINNYLNANDSEVEPPKNQNYAAWKGLATMRVTAYLNSALTKRGKIEWVDRNDEITVLGEEGNAYFVEYPVKNGTKHRWVRKSIVNKNTATNNNTNTSAIASAMQKAAQTAVNTNQFSYFNANDTNVERPSETNYSPWKSTAKVRATAYLNSGLSQTNGIEWVGKGDILTVYGEQGNAYLVEYPVKNGTKHRWIRKGIIGSGTVYKTPYTPNISSEEVSFWDSMVGKSIEPKLDLDCYGSYYNPFLKSYKSSKDGCYHETNCTWYAFGRFYEVNGQLLNGVSGMPSSWKSQAKKSGYNVGTEPRSKSIGIGKSHVIFVEFVSGSNVYYTDANTGHDYIVIKVSADMLKTKFPYINSYVYPK